MPAQCIAMTLPAHRDFEPRGRPPGDLAPHIREMAPSQKGPRFGRVWDLGVSASGGFLVVLGLHTFCAGQWGFKALFIEVLRAPLITLHRALV